MQMIRLKRESTTGHHTSSLRVTTCSQNSLSTKLDRIMTDLCSQDWVTPTSLYTGRSVKDTIGKPEKELAPNLPVRPILSTMFLISVLPPVLWCDLGGVKPLSQVVAPSKDNYSETLRNSLTNEFIHKFDHCFTSGLLPLLQPFLFPDVCLSTINTISEH